MDLHDLILVCFMFVGSLPFSSPNEGTNSEEITTATTTSPNLVSGDPFMNRASYRQLRLQHIRREILEQLGWRVPPQINSQSVADVRLVLASEYSNLLNANQLTEERRCVSTSCNLPRNIDMELWRNDSLSMGWRLFTGGTTRLRNTIDDVETAQLKLFLRIPEDFRCNNMTNDNRTPSTRFLVSVYQFIRPLKYRPQRSRRRIQNRKRMIDARMVGAHNQWVSLNVKTAVSDWLSDRRHNYGFEIGVRDDNENECNASAMFVPVNCDSPIDIGCVEEDVNTTPILPWVQPNVDENFPYLEVSYQVRRRSSRDTHHVMSRVVPNSVPPTPGQKFNQCFGKLEVIQIKDKWILHPKNYTSLICSGSCSFHRSNNEVTFETCHAISTRQVEGIYLNKKLKLRRGPLPYEQVLACGC